jgi:hypothetical protein
VEALHHHAELQAHRHYRSFGVEPERAQLLCRFESGGPNGALNHNDQSRRIIFAPPGEPEPGLYPAELDFSVEVLGRYSNRADQEQRIARLLQMALSESREPISKTIKQVHRRLSQDQIDELVVAYRAGATLQELSDHFQIHRASISIILERHSVPRRYRMVEGERLDGAIRAYQNGRSVISIADGLGVAGDTVRKALNRAGVKLRPRPGWRY